MNNIIDPVNGNSYDIFSFEGKNLLKNYVKAFQSGGTRSDVYNISSSDKMDTALDEEKKRCISERNTGPYCGCITGKHNCHPEKYLGITRNLHSHNSIAKYYVKKMEKGGFICPKCITIFDEAGELTEHVPVCEQIKFLVEKRKILVETLEKHGYTEFARKGHVDAGEKEPRPVEDVLKEIENLINWDTYKAWEFDELLNDKPIKIWFLPQLITAIINTFNINKNNKYTDVDKAFKDWIRALKEKALANKSSVEGTGGQVDDDTTVEPEQGQPSNEGVQSLDKSITFEDL